MNEFFLQGLGFGLKKPIGHVDFYPNGGKWQSGCKIWGPHCSHRRAYELFTDSINNMVSCPMTGHQCSSYKEFEEGSCQKCGQNGTLCLKMGYFSKLSYGASKERLKSLFVFHISFTVLKSPHCFFSD